jgi:hypothetical protein
VFLKPQETLMKTEYYAYMYLAGVVIALVLVLVQRFLTEANDAEEDRITGSEMTTLIILGPITPLWWLYKKIYDATPGPILKD